MSVTVCPVECHNYGYILQQTFAEEPNLSPQNQVPEQFSYVTHGLLKVADGDPGSPQPDDIKVKVFDASKVNTFELTLKSTDTTGILTKKYLESRPELVGNLHLIYNGKPVPKHTSLRELGVKTGTTFLTYQKCRGG